MQTISECVKTIIFRKPFIAEALQKDLINISSLARNIKPEIEELLKKEVQDGAVIMALQRYSQEKEIVISKNLRLCLNNISDVFVRSGLSEYTYVNSEDLFASRAVNLPSISSPLFMVFLKRIMLSAIP